MKGVEEHSEKLPLRKNLEHNTNPNKKMGKVVTTDGNQMTTMDETNTIIIKTKSSEP